jgi:hypothetical protein
VAEGTGFESWSAQSSTIPRGCNCSRSGGADDDIAHANVSNCAPSDRLPSSLPSSLAPLTVCKRICEVASPQLIFVPASHAHASRGHRKEGQVEAAGVSLAASVPPCPTASEIARRDSGRPSSKLLVTLALRAPIHETRNIEA